MERKYSRRGMVLVAPEVQGSTPEEIEEVVKEHRMKFAVTKGMRGPDISDGIPHMAVFDVEGKLVFSGYPDDDAEDVIRKELRRVAKDDGSESSAFGRPAEMVAMRTWTNDEGAELEAALLKVDGKTATFKLANGSTVPYDITKLSPEDQEIITKAAAE